MQHTTVLYVLPIVVVVVVVVIGKRWFFAPYAVMADIGPVSLIIYR